MRVVDALALAIGERVGWRVRERERLVLEEVAERIPEELVVARRLDPLAELRHAVVEAFEPHPLVEVVRGYAPERDRGDDPERAERQARGLVRARDARPRSRRRSRRRPSRCVPRRSRSTGCRDRGRSRACRFRWRRSPSACRRRPGCGARVPRRGARRRSPTGACPRARSRCARRRRSPSTPQRPCRSTATPSVAHSGVNE